VGAGHGCIGCSEPEFWDQMTPFYERLPDVQGFGVEINAEKVALGVAAVSAAAVAAHAIGSAVRKRTGEGPGIPVDAEGVTPENATRRKIDD
jgi:hydrogenase small subunit